MCIFFGGVFSLLLELFLNKMDNNFLAPLLRPLGGVWGGKAVALAQKVELFCGQKGRGVGREFLPAYKWSGGKKIGVDCYQRF